MTPDQPTAVSTVAAETVIPIHTDSDSTAPEPPSPRLGHRLLVAGAPVLILLTGVVLLGPRWMSPGSSGDAVPAAAVPSAVEPEPGLLAASMETPEAPLAEPPVSAPMEDATGGGRERAREAVGAPSPAPVSSASPPPPAPAPPPAVGPASSAEPPATPVPNPGAKDLYYASTRPGLAASAGEETTPAAVAAESAVNAGLKYRILRRAPGGNAIEVDADTLFRSGDRIRFAFEPNVDGFLYVIQLGSTGRWSVLFPHPQIYGGRNAVTRFGEVSIPPQDWFRFDENSGSEQVFVYLSNEPIDTLPWGGGPVVSAQSVEQQTVIELANSVRSRDLVFQKEDTPGGAEQAAYVVNQTAVGHAVAWTFELNHR